MSLLLVPLTKTYSMFLKSFIFQILLMLRLFLHLPFKRKKKTSFHASRSRKPRSYYIETRERSPEHGREDESGGLKLSAFCSITHLVCVKKPTVHFGESETCRERKW